MTYLDEGAEHCRNWIGDERCGKPAEFIVWGKLNRPEALGPRCYDCAAFQIGHHALRRNDNSYAVYRLPTPDGPASPPQGQDRAPVTAEMVEAHGRLLFSNDTQRGRSHFRRVERWEDQSDATRDEFRSESRDLLRAAFDADGPASPEQPCERCSGTGLAKNYPPPDQPEQPPDNERKALIAMAKEKTYTAGEARRLITDEVAFGAALEALGKTARESSDEFWPPLLHDILAIGFEAAAQKVFPADADGPASPVLGDEERERLTKLELEALLRVRMGGTADELADLRSAGKSGKEKLRAQLRRERER